MKTVENIKKVALIFFVILGLGHMVSGLMVANDYVSPYAYLVNQILEIPFAITAVMYGLASIQTGLKTYHKILNIIFINLTILIFAGLVYIEIFVANKPTS